MPESARKTVAARPLTRRQLLRALAGLGLLGTGAGLAQGYAAAQVNRVAATLPGLRSPLTVALLTDLHYGPYIREAQVRSWVDLALTARPDLTLVLGDFCDVNLVQGLPAPLLRQLARLRAPLGVYGVWGNHDYGSFSRYSHPGVSVGRSDWPQTRARFQAALAAGGLSILTNRGVSVRPDLWLGGVDDLLWGEPDAAAALAGCPDGVAQLLMMHEPDDLIALATRRGWQPGGLAVCGHTHGGQVRLPLLGAPIIPSAYGQRFAQGWVRGDPASPATGPAQPGMPGHVTGQPGMPGHVTAQPGMSGHITAQPGARGYVSRGLGLSGVPFRNLCPSEMVVLELHPA